MVGPKVGVWPVAGRAIGVVAGIGARVGAMLAQILQKSLARAMTTRTLEMPYHHSDPTAQLEYTLIK